MNILIADDHDFIRRGLKAIISAQAGWRVCADARNGTEAIAWAAELKPDVAILDLRMPEAGGFEATKRIKQVSPCTEILIMSMYCSDQIVKKAIEVGARGFLVKGDSERDLVSAVEALRQHKTFFTSYATDMMRSRSKGLENLRPSDIRDRLTARECEIIRLLAQGYNVRKSASILKISAATVETHRANIMRKLGAHTRADIVRYALRNNIIEP